MKRNAAIASVAIALLLCAAAYQVSAAQADDSITTTLHPGWNLIGWIHEATAASDLFEQLNELERIHDGDEREVRRAAANDPAALLTLQPGRGYWFRINADQPVIWTRPAEPATRRFHLEPGEQLVAWTGPSGRPVPDVLLGLRDQITLAWRWLAAEQRFIPWSPAPNTPSFQPLLVNRGEALQINLTEPVEWLHPTGDLPEIQFAGGLHRDLPDNFREMVEADVRFVVEQFAAKFKLEVPAEHLRIRVTTTPEAQIRQQENYNTSSNAFAFSPTTHHGVSVIVIPSTEWTQPVTATFESAPSNASQTLTHEYFHVMQHELAGPAGRRVPGWLSEGTAMWSEHIVLDAPRPNVDVLQPNTIELDLGSRLHSHDDQHYLGIAATAFLVQRASDDSIVEFWRKLGSETGLSSGWQHIFFVAFGVAFNDFAIEFDTYRRSLFTIVHGQVEGVDRAVFPSLRIAAYELADDQSRSALGLPRSVPYGTPQGLDPYSVERRISEVDTEGKFSLTLLRTAPGATQHSRYRLVVEQEGHWPPCVADVLPDGSIAWYGVIASDEAAFLELTSETLTGLTIRLSPQFCQHQVRTEVIGGHHDQLSISYCRLPGSCFTADRTSGKIFAAFLAVLDEYTIMINDHVSLCSEFISPDEREFHRLVTGPPIVDGTSVVHRIRVDSASHLCGRESPGR